MLAFPWLCGGACWVNLCFVGARMLACSPCGRVRTRAAPEALWIQPQEALGAYTRCTEAPWMRGTPYAYSPHVTAPRLGLHPRLQLMGEAPT